jgi:hypothetical protein
MIELMGCVGPEQARFCLLAFHDFLFGGPGVSGIDVIHYYFSIGITVIPASPYFPPFSA